MINIVSYIIYLTITFYITIVVGWKFYKLGFVYMNNLIKDTAVCESTNRLLLTGYYLVNLGYAAINLNNWNRIHNYAELISETASKIGSIILILCILHYINMTTIYFLRKKTI